MKYQQGDVIIRKISRIPDSVEKQNHLILAKGEATGHKHEIISGLAVLYASGNDMFFKILSESAKLRHEEHKEINIPKGNYQVGIIREYDHFEEETKKVVD